MELKRDIHDESFRGQKMTKKQLLTKPGRLIGIVVRVLIGLQRIQLSAYVTNSTENANYCRPIKF